MKLFLANGCSNTAGSEIDEHNMVYCHESSWPKWVADHYGMEHFNIAEPGSGNEQINRSTIITVSNLIENEKLNPKDLIVGILWSGFDRYEYWSEEKDKFRSFSMSSPKKFSPNQHITKYIEYRSLVETKDYAYYKNLYYMFNTAKFLESYGIEYYFTNCMNNFVHPNDLKASNNFKGNYANLLNLYGSRIDRHLGFFNGSDVFIQLLNDTPRSKLGTGFHWGEEGQKKYAMHFIEHMEHVNANTRD